TGKAARRLRDDRVLDRRRRLDRGHVRRAEHDPARPRGGGAHRRRRPGHHRAAAEAAADPQVDRVHGHLVVRDRHAAFRRTAARRPGEPGHGPGHLVLEPARLSVRLPVRGLQRGRRHRRRPAGHRGGRRGADRHAYRAVPEGGLMRFAARGIRLLILAAFAVFFVVPVLWLLLAPTKPDGALVTRNPLAFGSFGQIVKAWDHLDGFSDHIFRIWIGNSLLYAFSATAIVLLTAVPAGYGLALGRFRGRKLVLTVTLVVMIMPSAALVLPIFLELNALHLIGNVLSVILPFAFFPFGVYLAYIYYATAVPRDLLDAARVDGAGEWQTFRR